MGLTYRFIADPREPSEVLAWFRESDSPPTEVSGNGMVTLYFSRCGSLAYSSDGNVDPKASPVATLFQPRIKRGVLWTVGEVHFLATPLRTQFPELQKVNSAFRKWLTSFDCVFSNRRADNEFDYYLEGSIKNFDPPVYAVGSGMEALRTGQYYINQSDNDRRVDEVCQMLASRGIECTA